MPFSMKEHKSCSSMCALNGQTLFPAASVILKSDYLFIKRKGNAEYRYILSCLFFLATGLTDQALLLEFLFPKILFLW
jgi:hypothetical protein